jgi:hypothetical protein
MTSDIDAAQTAFSFGTSFLRDHAGQIISDQRVALIELIANSFDAGAYAVEIQWPERAGDRLCISDDGTGMSEKDFLKRWKTLSYNRLEVQGPMAEFPPGVPQSNRVAFGRSGKGRHAALCFADEYTVETWNDGKWLCAKIQLTKGGQTPFRCKITERRRQEGHGTRVWTVVRRNVLRVGDIVELIGSKFAVDPSFCVQVNGQRIELLNLKNVTTDEVEVSTFGTVQIHRVDSAVQHRTSRLHGITWWVNKRMVGDPSWDGLDGAGHYLDGRTAEAKRYSFVVEANLLKDETKPDWTGFRVTPRFNAVRSGVHEFVVTSLRRLLGDMRKKEKKTALEEHRQLIGELPVISRQTIGKFVDEVQERCPTLSPRDLSRTVEIYAKLEQSRAGYDLLKKLASCSPDDLDTWNTLMGQWTADHAALVLNELQKRLELIRRLQELVRDRHTDEVHDLQPLFERGLWIFGPEYEAVDFRSNRGMAEVVRRFFGRQDETVSRRRPDFVALPDRSIGIYGSDAYDDGGEVIGIRKVLIVELKKGAFELTQKELDQARDYAKELRRTGCAPDSSTITAFVLGADLEAGLEQTKFGSRDENIVIPLRYDIVLARAHARTFNLQRRLEQSQPAPSDPEVDQVLSDSLPTLLVGRDLQVDVLP